MIIDGTHYFFISKLTKSLCDLNSGIMSMSSKAKVWVLSDALTVDLNEDANLLIGESKENRSCREGCGE